MRRKHIRLMTMSTALALGIALSSCSSNIGSSESTPTSTVESTPDASNTEIKPSEDTTPTKTNTETKPSTESTNTEGQPPVEKKDRYNDIAKKLKLDISYQGKTFLEDGIEEVILTSATDGDTASFATKNSKFSFRVRFFDIDTPESTGSVEKWGKNASKYTASILENAYALLVESSVTKVDYEGAQEYAPPRDSYGERYLGYVWYKETEDSDWVNLNLEIVENGYSESKCKTTSPYYRYFRDALSFAKSVPLHIWSNDDDPYFVSGSKEVTVKELATNASLYYDSATGTGDKVHFTGFVSDIYKPGDTYTYKISDFDEEGNIYTFDVYAGYASTSIPDYMKIGGKFSLTGSIQLHSGKYQVSGLTYVPLQNGGDYLTQIQEEYYITFNSSIEYSPLYYTTTLFSDAVVTSAKYINDTTIVIEATAKNTYKVKNRRNFRDYVEDKFTFKCNTDGTVNILGLVGQSFSVKGFQEIDGSKTIMIKDYSNIIWK